MISTNYNSSFPDQVVPDEEKQTLEYGVKVGQAIEFEWFRNNRSGGDRFLSNYQNYHRLKLYARGEHACLQSYKHQITKHGFLYCKINCTVTVLKCLMK